MKRKLVKIMLQAIQLTDVAGYEYANDQHITGKTTSSIFLNLFEVIKLVTQNNITMYFSLEMGCLFQFFS